MTTRQALSAVAALLAITAAFTLWAASADAAWRSAPDGRFNLRPGVVKLVPRGVSDVECHRAGRRLRQVRIARGWRFGWLVGWDTRSREIGAAKRVRCAYWYG